ncbi:ECE [Lepeophtheirus salmonis]|uniref:ECE n=1 Tax=Lepeophtheirus salmonis TaxID=72036 RepID=A0A7R8D5W1_LEPSM|nr:ECE [Lepeophtheirus salmonis]CAF3038880.1 ECE [Lepeophtheirus salmonis]
MTTKPPLHHHPITTIIITTTGPPSIKLPTNQTPSTTLPPPPPPESNSFSLADNFSATLPLGDHSYAETSMMVGGSLVGIVTDGGSGGDYYRHRSGSEVHMNSSSNMNNNNGGLLVPLTSTDDIKLPSGKNAKKELFEETCPETMGASWPVSRLRHSGPLSYCTTPSCLQAAASILASQNASYSPCSEFWQYACGSWLSTHSIPASKSYWSVLEEAKAGSREDKSRLITTSSHEPSQFNSLEWKVSNFYHSCMSLSFIESDKEKPLLKIINSLGGWHVLRSFNLYSWDSRRVLRELHSEFAVHALFRIGVVPDVQDPDYNIIAIYPDGLGMSDKSYYHRLPDDPAVVAYQTYLKDSAMLFGASSPEAHKFSIDMFNFEKRISEITPSGEYLSDPRKINNKMTVKDLHTMSMTVPWLEILKAAFSDASTTEETGIIVVSPQYVADIAVIMSTTDRGSLNNYLMWRLAETYMPYLSKNYREVVDVYRKSISGAQKPLERWEFCQETTDRFFGHYLNAIYSQRDNIPDSVVKKVFDYIKHTVAKTVSVSSHFEDYESRRATVGKLKNMSIQIGTPDFLRDRKNLKTLYKDLLVQTNDFFQNILYGVSFLRKRQEALLLHSSESVSQLENEYWLESLNQESEIVYVPSRNKVVVPELFLRSPFVDPGYPNSINMGGIGVRLTEAVINGIIGIGLYFDSKGRFVDEENNNNKAHNKQSLWIEMSAERLMKSYSSNRIDTPDYLKKCRSDTVLSLIALQQSLFALEDILSVEKGLILPALEMLDPQSLFFLAYGQSLCASRTFKRRDIDRTSGHSLLNQEKLKGALLHLNEFSHFYFCGDNSLSSSSSKFDRRKIL